MKGRELINTIFGGIRDWLLSLQDLVGSALTVAAIVSILVFVTKETIEYCRRRAASRRKIHALKILISRELSEVVRGISNVRSVLADIEKGFDDVDVEIFVEEDAEKAFTLEISTKGHGLWSRTKILMPRVELLGKHTLDVAVEDKKMFKDVLEAQAAVFVVERVISELIEGIRARGGEGYYSELIRQGEAFDFIGGHFSADLQNSAAKLKRIYKELTGDEIRSLRLD